MAYQSESAKVLKRLREMYNEDPQKSLDAARTFVKLRNSPSSGFYAPYASGKSNYKELTDFFSVDRFDDDFFRTNAGLTQYMRYGASGTPLAPTKKSSPYEVAAYQYYRAQKADEYTRTLEDQWRALQRELSDKVSFDMDDDAIIQSIDWSKYGALKDYENNVRIRNTPLLTRPVAYDQDALYGALGAARNGKKIGQTDYDYLPDLVDYYGSKNKPQMVASTAGNQQVQTETPAVPAAASVAEPDTRTRLPFAPKSADDKTNFGLGNIDLNSPGRKPVNFMNVTSAFFPVSFWDDQEKKQILVPTLVNGQRVNDAAAIQHYRDTGEYLGKFDDKNEADAYADRLKESEQAFYAYQPTATPKPEQPAGASLQNEFNALQYKMYTGQQLTPEQAKQWKDLYPSYNHTGNLKGLNVSSSGGGSLSIEKQNEEWFTRYSELLGKYYTGSDAQSKLQALVSDMYAANDSGLTVPEYMEARGGVTPWLKDLDIAEWNDSDAGQTTMVRPINEILLAYRRGEQLTEAENEIIWQYDKSHPNLLGGMKQARAAEISMPIDMRRQLGSTAFAALTAADSKEITPEESAALILSIGQDMDAAFGRYDTLEDYYAANPARAEVLQAFVGEEKARTERTAETKSAEDVEKAKQFQQYAMNALLAYSKGDPLDEDQNRFISDIKAMPVGDADKDTAYKDLEKSILDIEPSALGRSIQELPQTAASDAFYAGIVKTGDTYADMAEIKRIALSEILATDVKLAKSAGLTLEQYYEMFPDMQKDSTEIMNLALKAYEEKWADHGGIFEFVWGRNANELTGEGVGTGTALLKGGESGARQFWQGNLGFVRNYITETDEANVQAWNRARYGGPMGRMKAGKDFDAAIARITDPERRTYWENYKSNVKDIYDLPFNYSDETILNNLYENKKALSLIESFMLSNGTPGEYAAFMISQSVVDNGLSMGVATAATALTGNPTIGVAVGFGPRSAYEGSEIARAAGMSREQANTLGLGVAAVTIFTEKMAFVKLKNSAAYIRGSINSFKTAAASQGTRFLSTVAKKVAAGTATIGVKLGETMLEQGGQEALESILSDTWLNITGAQNKEFGVMIDESMREAIMAAIVAPFMTAQVYTTSSGKQVQITKETQATIQTFMESKINESMKNPETVTKIIEANADEQTVNTLINGGLENIDTSGIDQTREDLKAAEMNVVESDKAFTAARVDYADTMDAHINNGTVISDAEHGVILRAIEDTNKAYQAARKVYNVLNTKLQQSLVVLGQQVQAAIKTARAESLAQAQAEFLSEAAATWPQQADIVPATVEQEALAQEQTESVQPEERQNNVQPSVDAAPIADAQIPAQADTLPSAVDVAPVNVPMSNAEIIDNNTGVKLTAATVVVLDQLDRGEDVAQEDVVMLPEIGEAATQIDTSLDTSQINTPERTALRQQILNELLAHGSYSIDESGEKGYTGTVAQGRRVDIVIGLPAAGKSSVLVNPLSQKYQARVVDSDMAKEMLPEYRNGLGAGNVHEESKAISADLLIQSLEAGDNIVYPIVGGGDLANLRNKILSFKEKGYSVYLHLNELSSPKAIGRALKRYFQDGRFVPPQVLYRYGNSPTQNFNSLIAEGGLLDGYSHYSNDVPYGQSPNLIRESGEMGRNQPDVREDVRGRSHDGIDGEESSKGSPQALTPGQNQGIVPPTTSTVGADFSAGDMGKRQFANQTAQSTEFLPDYIKNELLNNPEQSDYQRQQNTEQVVEGYRRFKTAGYDQTINDLLSKDRFDSYDTATALVMMAEAKNRNDLGSLMAVAGKYNQLGTTAGQEMQARKIFLKMTPVGAMSTAAADAQNALDAAWNGKNKGWRDNVNKQAEAAKAEVLKLSAAETDGGKNKWGIELNQRQLALIDRYGLGGVNRPGIHYNRASLKQRMLEAILATPNVAAASNNGLSLVDRLEYMRAGLPVVTNADLNYIGLRMGEFMGAGQDTGGRDAAVAIARAQEAHANIKPSTSAQKVKTYRMVSMLGNITTPLRNIIGNVGQNLLNDVSKIIASGADWAISKGTGVRTVSAPTVKERIDGMKAFIQETENTFRDFLIDKVDTGGENKYEAHGKRIYQSPIIEAAKNIAAFALSLGDRPFYKRTYVQSIAEQMRVSGTSITTQEMVERATSEAKYATLTEDNKVAEGIRKLKQVKSFGIGKIIDFLIPFDLVPSNIVRRTIEYSPIGLADAVVHQGLWMGLKNHSFDQKAFVNGLARGLTGTGLFAVGMALQSIGAIKLGTGEDDDKDLANIRATTGDQYSPYIEVFGQKVGFSFLTPSISAMIMGASVYDAVKDNENAVTALWNGVASMGDQIFDASYLTALQDVFSGGESVFENAVTTIPGNALSQFIPSILRQVGNGLDPYVRDTNEKDLVMRAIKKGIWTNLPYLRELLPAKIDVSGKPVKSKDMLNSLLNPAYITEDADDPVLDEMLRLVDATGESSFLPTDNLYGARNTLTNGARPLNDAEKEAYKIRKGTLLMDGGRTIDKSGAEVTMPGLRALMASDTFKRMTDQQKADAVKGQVDAANAGVNAEYLRIVGAVAKEKQTDYTPKASTTVPVYFADTNPWYMDRLNKLYEQTGDASYLPTAIGTTFSREKKEYTVPENRVDVFYKLYDAELSKRLSNLDWGLTGQELAEKVKSTITGAQDAAKNKWFKEGYWK